MKSTSILPLIAAGLWLAVPVHAAESSTETSGSSATVTETQPAAALDLATVQQQLASSDEDQRAKARKALEKAAASDASDASEAGVVLGEAWLRGLFSEKPDAKKAVEWWTKAGEAGNGHAWWLLGALHSGDLGNRDVLDATKATAAFRKAGEAGEPKAYIPLGSRVLNGIGCEADEAGGLDWLNKSINEARTAKAQSRPASFFAYVVAARYFADKGDDEKAIGVLRQGVEVEDAECMMALSRMLIADERSPEQKQEAVKLAEQAADAGLPEAVREMVAAEQTKDAPRKLKIYEWLQKAALRGDALLQQELGTLHYSGWFTGVREPAAAAYWLATAARAGLPQAQYLFGNQLEKGDGVPRDYQAAFAHFKAAMEQGHAGATLGYARYLPEGGYPEDAKPDLARAWAVAKLAKGRAEAVKDAQVVNAASAYIGTLSEKMEPEQFAEAKTQYDALAKQEQARLAEIAKRQEEAKAAAEAAQKAEAAEKAAAAEAKNAGDPESLVPEGATDLGAVPTLDQAPR